MADSLTLISGSSAAYLSAFGATLRRFAPGTPRTSVTVVERELSDDVDVPSVAYHDVTESAEVIYSGAGSVTSAENYIGNLNRMLELARLFQQTKIGNRVYVEFLKDGATDTYRSEILAGQVFYDPEVLTAAYWARNKVLRLTVTWKRRFYWEWVNPADRTALVDVPISNSNGSNQTNGLTVYNHDDTDAGHDNYVEINSSNVAGDLPAPVQLEITNTYNSATRMSNVWVGHGYQGSPVSLVHILEAESGTGGTTTADAGASGGNRKDSTWSGTSEAQLLSWTLGTSLLNACAGNYFRVLARLTGDPGYTDAWLRLTVRLSVSPIWQGPLMLLSQFGQIQDLGVVQLPPYLVGSGDLYPLDLVLFGYRSSGASTSLGIDYLQLTPLDGWRKLTPRGFGLAYLARLVDDGIDGYTYTDGWSTAGKTGHYIGFGQPVQLYPNKTQRLYFLFDNTSSAAAIDRTLSVKLKYRPRKLAL